MKKFNVGEIYTKKCYLGDNFWDNSWPGYDPYSYEDFKCIKRTNTFITLERIKKGNWTSNTPDIIRKKIKIDDECNEYVFFETSILEA